MIENCIFDFDGVIAESVDVKTKAFQKMYNKYGEDLVQKITEHHKNNGGISRFTKFQLYNSWVGINISPEHIQKMSIEFSRLVKIDVVNSPEVTGATDFFIKMFNHYRFYIVSGTPMQEIIEIASERNIDKFFKNIYGSPETKGFWVNHILTSCNLIRNNTVFIGDAIADYLAAVENQIHFILRETCDNENIFSFYSGPRIKNFNTLSVTLMKL
ncbi:MAG: HAD hydrolase-like protein [Bacteroidota bacterium]